MITVTKEMIRQIECPKCGAEQGQPCKHRKDAHHRERMQAARLHFERDIKQDDK